MANNNRPSQQAEEEVNSEAQHDSEPCADPATLHFHSLVSYSAIPNHYMNILLLFIPVGVITGALGAPGVVVFIFNFIPLIQLAAVIALTIQVLTASTGTVLGGLLHILLNNPGEMIISIIAVVRGQLRVAQGSLVGSILSYSLLILGSCFWFGGYGKVRLEFNDPATSILEATMMLMSISLIVPRATSTTLPQSHSPEPRVELDKHGLLVLSHGAAIILIATFAVYLYFRLKSHADYLNKSTAKNSTNRNGGSGPALEEPLPFRPAVAACVFIAAILCTIVCSYYLVDSIDGLAASLHIGKTFISLVLIPFAGNAGRYTSIMAMVQKNRTDLAVKAIVSSVLLITLLIIPSAILLGWIIDQPMALDFTTFEMIIFLLAILVVNCVVQVGKATYFDGVMLIGTYIVVTAALFLCPEPGDSSIAAS